MAEKIAELVPTNEGCSIVLKTASFSNDLMASTGLDITFFDPNGSTELARVTLKPEEIEFDGVGFKSPLPVEINNELAQKVNSYGGKFKVKALEYDPASSKTVGDASYFDAGVTGTLKVIQNCVKKEGESITEATFGRKTPLSEEHVTEDSTADTAENSALKTSDTVLNETASLQSSNTATPAAKSSSKGKILAIIAAIVLLLFILGLLALFLTGFLGGSKDNGSSNEAAPQEQTEETSDSAAKDEEKLPSDNSSASDGSEENAPVQESQDNTPANDPEVKSAPSENTTAASDAANTSSSAVCVITSDPDSVMIKNCLASKPDSSTVSAFAKEAFSKDKCDLGKRLFSSYGRKDGTVAYAYAQYFDPNSTDSSGCATKDKTQAVYWYEKAVELGNDNAKNALSALKN